MNFPHHKPVKKLCFLSEYIFEYMEPELIIGRDYIYFADIEDYRLLCFDANENVENNENRIVFIDHEDLENIHIYLNNF